MMALSSIPTGLVMFLIAWKCLWRSGLGVFRDIRNLAVLFASMPLISGERVGLKCDTRRFIAWL